MAITYDMYMPRRMLMNLGSITVVSAPHGIKLAPRFEENTESMKPRETIAMPARVPEFHSRSSMRFDRSHGFHFNTPHA